MMRVALLGPARRASAAGEQMALLAVALAAEGASVARFECGAKANEEALALADLASRAREFEIAHSFLGALPLAAAATLGAPLLTTLAAPVDPALAALCARTGQFAWFVAAGEAARLAGVAFVSTIQPAADAADARRMATEYLAVYAKIAADAAARRIDKVHDKRPWGEYFVLSDTPTFKVKRIDVLAGKRLSYQRHKHRSEHWMVVGGSARVTLDGREILLCAGQAIDVPAGTWHRIENCGQELLSFVEVQHGTYFGEDDIERQQDDFGRK
jgi:mannose-6-phosphate isomerase-like protein (cupin superfamily)